MWLSICDWGIWQCGIQSKKVMCCSIKVIVASSLINREMTKTGRVVWLCGSYPLGYIITWSRENKYMDSDPSVVPFVCFRKVRLLIPTVGGDIFGTLRYSEWPAIAWPEWQVVLVHSSVFYLEMHWSGGSPLPSHVENPFSNKRRTVLIVPNYAGTWDASIPAILICTCNLDTIIISLDFDIKWFGYRKEKPVRVYVRRGLTRCLWFEKSFQR